MPNRNSGPALVEALDLKVSFAAGRTRGRVHAVDGVNLTVNSGETVALVGESGSGKTTTGRAIVGLHPVDSGEVHFLGKQLITHGRRDPSPFDMQMLFQDHTSSLNPRQRIGSAITEPLAINGKATKRDRRDRALTLLQMVGLNADYLDRFPHELSGGQRQRVGIARALALNPKLLVADEPVSALDLSVQAQIINLLKKIQAETSIALLFIAHDLAVVRQMADRVAVMYLGRIVEYGDANDVYESPRHPYTVALLSAVLTTDPGSPQGQRIVLTGEIPDPGESATGCRFQQRCWLNQQLENPAICSTENPVLQSTSDGTAHQSACHFSENVTTELRARS